MDSTYKKTVSGSLGSGVGSLLNGSGKSYYILEHKNDTLYHKRGESQKIIVDQIELGRDANCAVRFDEACETVSRHHAAIEKDGDGWKIINLSKTNTTLVNGQPINGEWHLSSGDEIQLSGHGPVMGFIVPQGHQSAVSSIGMGERIKLFNAQALRPYKVAVIILALILAALICLAVLGAKKVKAEKAVLEGEIAEMQQEIVYQDVNDYLNSIYYIKMDDIAVFDTKNSEIVRFATDELIGGTGFLLNDGRFVTAHSVIEPWYFRKDLKIGSRDNYTWTFSDIQYAVKLGYKVVANFTAYSNSGSNFQFKNTDMTCSDLLKSSTNNFTVENYKSKTMSSVLKMKTASGDLYWFDSKPVADWACMAKSEQLSMVGGGIPYDASLSTNPVANTETIVFGFPFKAGFTNSQNVEPSKAKNNINVSGLSNAGIIEMASRRYQPGLDGAPVFVWKEEGKNARLYVIGILSHADDFDRDVVIPIDFATKK